MAGLKPVYLISGDDDPKIDSWRTRVRRRAEDENGPGALETFHGQTDKPEVVAAALATLTFAAGDRYLLVDGAEAWKAGELDPLERAIDGIPEGTVLVLVVRGKPLARLAKAVDRAGGEQREYTAPKPWQLPKWTIERAAEEGLRLDQEAAKALGATVGTPQQRIAREVERLATLAHPHTQLSADQVRRAASGEATEQVYDLADALVAGDLAATMRLAEALTSGAGESPSKLIWPIVRRLRDVHRAAELLDAGVPEGKVAGAMKMPPWAAKRTLAQAKKADRDALARALCAFADLEIELRGGGVGLDEGSAFSLTLARAAA